MKSSNRLSYRRGNISYNPWWWIETLGGLVPPPPRDLWLQQFLATIGLANAAQRDSPQLRASVLEIALEQIEAASATLKQQIEGLQRKKDEASAGLLGH
jgi:hypothetical protein